MSQRAAHAWSGVPLAACSGIWSMICAYRWASFFAAACSGPRSSCESVSASAGQSSSLAVPGVQPQGLRLSLNWSRPFTHHAAHW